MASESTNNIMKKALLAIITLISTVCVLAGQTKYSGIYNLTARYMGESASALMAVTLGGRMFSGNEEKDDLDLYKSVVTSKGKFNATDYGRSVSFVGSIDSKYNVTGTFKYQGMTARVSGKRVLK
jgi:hypothetical protein